MSVYEKISGFADEISQDFDQQLKTVTDLGMKYICIRSAEHKGIADYTPEEVRTVLLPKLRAAGVGVSSRSTVSRVRRAAPRLLLAAVHRAVLHLGRRCSLWQSSTT